MCRLIQAASTGNEVLAEPMHMRQGRHLGPTDDHRLVDSGSRERMCRTCCCSRASTARESPPPKLLVLPRRWSCLAPPKTCMADALAALACPDLLCVDTGIASCLVRCAAQFSDRSLVPVQGCNSGAPRQPTALPMAAVVP